MLVAIADIYNPHTGFTFSAKDLINLISVGDPIAYLPFAWS